MHEATNILKSLGHEIVEFKIPNVKEIINIYYDHMLSDGGITSLEIWEGEILDQVTTSLSTFTKIKIDYSVKTTRMLFMLSISKEPMGNS